MSESDVELKKGAETEAKRVAKLAKELFEDANGPATSKAALAKQTHDDASRAKQEALDVHTAAENEQAAAELALHEAQSSKESDTRELAALGSRKLDLEQQIPAAEAKEA